MKIDEYTIHARVYPTLVCVVPVLLLIFTFENESMMTLLSDISAVEIAGKTTVALAMFFLLMQISRLVGKEGFERVVFDHEQKFPTTEFLVPGNLALSRDFKAQLAQKIAGDFKLTLPTEDDFVTEPEECRRRIRDIVARIRAAVDKPSLLLQRNWEYGFFRNLTGGSLVALMVSVVGIAFHRGTTIGVVFVVLPLHSVCCF